MARDLNPGDLIITADNTAIVSRTVQSNHHDFVYNFTVANHNNYFVGKQQLWVHNVKAEKCGGGDGPERLDPQFVTKRMEELAAQGHGPQRHGADITLDQLIDRAVNGIDPITGTVYDAYRKNPDGTKALHAVGRNATRFTSDEAFIRAEKTVRESPIYERAKSSSQDGYFQVDMPASEVFGQNYLDHFEGATRLGSRNNPAGWESTDFTNATVRARYNIDLNGRVNLITIYPEPQ